MTKYFLKKQFIMKRLISLFILLATVFTGFAQGNPWHRGEGQFEYEYPNLPGKKITVYYYIPTSGDITSMRVLFSMHGAERSGKTSRFVWKEFAEADGFIVIAPEYSKEYFIEREYQYGGVYDENGNVNPREKWTYSTVEAIFDLFLSQTGSHAEVYDMWGHSAGGQFTHRYTLAMPEARLGTAVAANPGTWTFPLLDGLKAPSGKVYGWPYSLLDSPFDEAALRKFFARKLVVSLGNMDTATSGKHVPTYEAAIAQGKYRFERGRNFYKLGRSLAKKMGAEFNWKKVEVEGIGHAGRGMTYGTYKTVNGKAQYSIDNITRTGAYSILYR